MTLTIHTANTLLLGIYTQDELTVCLGNLRCVDGELVEAIDDADTDIWSLLDRVLTDAKTLGADNLITFSNDRTLVDFGTPPIHVPQTDGKTDKILTVRRGERGRYEHVPGGGDVRQWRIVRNLCLYRRWHFQYTDNLPKARERWQQQQQQYTVQPQ